MSDRNSYILEQKDWDEAATRASGNAVLTTGNHIQYLQDAGENFPAWKRALLSARQFICIEMYIWDDNAFGKEIRTLLLDKLQEGVRVYIVYDWLGSLKSHLMGFFTPLKSNGAQVYAFNRWGILSGFGLMARNHRKSIIIDGQIAFVAGLCISSVWSGDPEHGIPPWRDSGVSLSGPVALKVLDAFLETWRHFPKASFTEKISQAQVIKTGTDKARIVATELFNSNMLRLDLLAISFAKSSIWISDAYFMPAKMYSELLILAAQNGVDVRLLVPRSSDIKWIAAVSRTQYRALLEAGVKIYEWNGSMLHAKTLVIDGNWARVGSTNMNVTSWFANSELDVVLEGKQETAPLVAAYLKDIQHATEVVLGAAAPKNRRQEKRGQSAALKSKVIAKQMMSLSKHFDGLLRNSVEKKEVVDHSEAYAFLFISIFFMVVTLLIAYIPALIGYPLVVAGLFMVVVTATRCYHAFKGLRRNRHKNQQD